MIFTAAALFVAAAVLIILLLSRTYLVLENAETGVVYAKYRQKRGDTFSVEFIHSVNKSSVRDFYELRDGKIYCIEAHYYAFGAGVQTELNIGEWLEYGDDGAIQIKNINRLIPDLTYVVGTISDHVLSINGEEVSLRELCGKSSKVRFSVAGG